MCGCGITDDLCSVGASCSFGSHTHNRCYLEPKPSFCSSSEIEVEVPERDVWRLSFGFTGAQHASSANIVNSPRQKEKGALAWNAAGSCFRSSNGCDFGICRGDWMGMQVSICQWYANMSMVVGKGSWECCLWNVAMGLSTDFKMEMDSYYEVLLVCRLACFRFPW